MSEEDTPMVICETGHPGSARYLIRPHDIKVRLDGTVGTFDRYETSLAAGNLLRFFQHRGRWCSFRIDEFDEFCAGAGRNGKGIALFEGLTGLCYDNGPDRVRWVGSRYVVLLPNGICAITQSFVECCAKT